MKFLIHILIFFCFNLSYSQEDLELKLNERYSTERVQRIINNKGLTSHFKKLTFDSYQLKEVKDLNSVNKLEKLSGLKKINKAKEVTFVTSEDIVKSIKDKSFNILTMDIQPHLTQTKTYFLKNTKYTLTILSKKALQQ